MAARAVPVTLEGFGVERNLDTPLFGDTDEEISRHPEVVTHLDAFTGTDLEFPLSRHHLGVDATNFDAGVEAGAVVGFNEITSKNLAST